MPMLMPMLFPCRNTISSKYHRHYELKIDRDTFARCTLSLWFSSSSFCRIHRIPCSRPRLVLDVRAVDTFAWGIVPMFCRWGIGPCSWVVVPPPKCSLQSSQSVHWQSTAECKPRPRHYYTSSPHPEESVP
eukprot:scaffold2511_cov25-Cyclotella_meneghiniana.AAC.2